MRYEVTFRLKTERHNIRRLPDYEADSMRLYDADILKTCFLTLADGFREAENVATHPFRNEVVLESDAFRTSSLGMLGNGSAFSVSVSETELESPENGPSKHDPFTMVIRIGNNDKSAFGKDKRAVEEIFDDLQRMMDDGRDGLRVEAVMFIARPLAKKNMTCSNEKDVRSL